jgi:hypothetical protein
LSPAEAADPKPVQYRFESHLIWATDADKPEDPRLRELSENLQGKLKYVKWKNIWEVGDKRMLWVAAGATNKVRISPLCEIEIHHLDKENFEIKLFGEKKPVPVIHKMRESFAEGRTLVLSGDDKNNSAWFVVLMLAPTSTTSVPKAPKNNVEAARTNRPPTNEGKTNKPAGEGSKTNRADATVPSK